MKVSVIVSNYNHGIWIKEAVESILNQTHQNLEVVIVDDASTDGSQDIINDLVKLDKRIKTPILFSENTGKWNCLNTAIATQCSGKLITTQDADDWSLPQRLERQIECLNKTNTFHNLCGFHHCWSRQEMNSKKSIFVSEPVGEESCLGADKVVPMVYAGFKNPNIQHFHTGNFETHGASALFYKQLWDNGIRFNPPKKGLRIAWGDDGDFNHRVCLLMQKTSLLLEKMYLYARNTSTHGTGVSINECCL